MMRTALYESNTGEYEYNLENDVHWKDAPNPRLSYLASLQEQFYQEEGSIRIEIHSTPYYVMLNRLDRESYSAFRSGGCTLLSYAIHQITGLPVAAFGIDGRKNWAGHTAVQIAPDAFADITGIFTEKELLDDFRQYSFVELSPARIVSNEDALYTVTDKEYAEVFPQAFMTELEWLVIEDFAKRVIRECIIPYCDKNRLDIADELSARLLQKDIQDKLGESLLVYR